MNKIKVLHILWSGGIGGAEEYVASLVKHFDYSKYDIYLCFLHKKGAIFEEAIKMKNVKVDFIGIKNRFDMRGVLRFVRYLYREKFDIIHSHIRGSYLYAGVLSLFKVPKILTHHLSPGDTRLHKDAKIFYKLYSGLFQKVTVISEVVKKNLIDDLGIKHPDRIEVVYNGIDLNKYSESCHIPSDLQAIKNSNEIIIGYVGRMQYFKRPQLFIEIAEKLIKINKKIIFVMVGDGPELEECKKLINGYKIEKHFKLLGFRRDIPDVMKLFDALLFTSKGEGFGMVLIEAMAMGIPVIAINEGAVPEIITHMENGILLDLINPKIIAQQISEVLEDKRLIAKIKKKCKDDVYSKYSIVKSVNQIEEIYNKVIHNTT